MKTEAHGAGGLNSLVAAEIRAELGRRQWSQVELATRLGVDPMWLNRRLRAVKPLTLTELEAIARVLEVEPADLLTRGGNLSARTSFAYTARPGRPPNRRPDERAHRPKGRTDVRKTERRSSPKRALTPEELRQIAA